jgi:hypothetical protein
MTALVADPAQASVTGAGLTAPVADPAQASVTDCSDRNGTRMTRSVVHGCGETARGACATGGRAQGSGGHCGAPQGRRGRSLPGARALTYLRVARSRAPGAFAGTATRRARQDRTALPTRHRQMLAGGALGGVRSDEVARSGPVGSLATHGSPTDLRDRACCRRSSGPEGPPCAPRANIWRTRWIRGPAWPDPARPAPASPQSAASAACR